MIGSIQLLRGLAALSVVFYHTAYLEPTDFGGVAIFFVISGFIVTYVTRDDASFFIRKRVIRIVPLYWFVTLFSLIWYNFGFSNPPYMWPLWADWFVTDPGNLRNWFVLQYKSVATPELAWSFITSLFFIPTAKAPLVSVGWTLNLEMAFYLIFAACLWINQRKGPAIAAVVVVVLQIVLGQANCGPACTAYSHNYFRFFVLGIGAYYAWRKVEALTLRHRGATAVLSIAMFIVWPLYCLFGQWSALMHYFGPTGVVFAALCLHSAGYQLRDRFTMAFGAISYALYLVHPLVIETLRATSTIAPWLVPTTTSGMLSALAVSVLLAMLAHYGFEKPVMSALRPLMAKAPRLKNVPA